MNAGASPAAFAYAAISPRVRNQNGNIACFPYVETAPEGHVPLEAYPGVLAWLARCKALPGWAERER